MVSLKPRVKEIQRAHDHVVLEERPITAVAWFFAGLAVVALIWLWNTAAVALSLVPALFGLHASVESLFIANRLERLLIVRRRLALWTFEKRYATQTIHRIYVRDTLKGSALALRFKSGGSKDPFNVARRAPS